MNEKSRLVCRGSMIFGSGCGHCARCKEERDRMQTGSAVTVRTAELSGRALDWAVGRALGYQIEILPSEYNSGPRLFYNGQRWAPSTDWSQGGPLIDRFGISVIRYLWEASNDPYIFARGESSLVQICRAVVRMHLPPSVDIPAELAGGEHARND